MFDQIQQLRNRLQPYGLTALRAILGAIFVQHGWWKVAHFDLAVELFAQWGLPFPIFSVQLAAATELLGGIALILGIGVLVASVPLAFTLAMAIYYVHGPAGFWLPNGYEFVLALLVAVVAVGLLGPGAFALHHAVFPRSVAPLTQESRQAVQSGT